MGIFKRKKKIDTKKSDILKEVEQIAEDAYADTTRGHDRGILHLAITSLVTVSQWWYCG
jgi:hypothetical protein